MMTGKEKLYFLLDAIDNARAITAKNRPVYIHPANNLNNKYTEIELDELFYKLGKEENIIVVLQNPHNNKIKLAGYDDYYALLIRSNFDEYYHNIQKEPDYQEFSGVPILKKKSQIENLSDDNFDNVFEVLARIESELQLSQSEKFTINFVDSVRDVENYDSNDINELIENNFRALGYLKNIGVIRYFSTVANSLYAEIILNTTLFDDVLMRAKNRKNHSNKDEMSDPKDNIKIDGNDKVLYEIRYSEQSREILVNNFLLKKLHSFSDNDAIFAYLYENANKVVSVKDIKAGTKLTSIKDLNKFLENIGFTGELRKVFFKVSKDQVRFNNPVAKKDLEEIGISYLKLK